MNNMHCTPWRPFAGKGHVGFAYLMPLKRTILSSGWKSMELEVEFEFWVFEGFGSIVAVARISWLYGGFLRLGSSGVLEGYWVAPPPNPWLNVIPQSPKNIYKTFSIYIMYRLYKISDTYCCLCP